MGNCYGSANCLINSTELELSNLDIKTLAVFIPPVNSGRVIKVYDGDTITIASKVSGLKNSDYFKFSVRMNGYDSPEMKTKNDEEREVAKLAQKALSDKIMGRDVILRNVRLEKYGRLLCEVYLGDLHLNKWMMDNRYGIAYGGGTKIIPNSWKAYLHDGTI